MTDRLPPIYVPSREEPFADRERIAWTLRSQIYRTQDWCEQVRGDDETS